MLKSKKHVLWEALIITIAIFLSGIFFGMLLETSNSIKISDLFTQSEISLTDATLTSKLIEDLNLDCNKIKYNDISFANRIYEEAKTLERYEGSGKLTDNIKLLHKKYDLLRTLLWTNNQKYLNICKNYNLLVYLYEYDTKNISKKATQNVWSKILLDTKKQNDDILLLPIAIDQNLTSLNLLISEYNATRFPALVINNKEVLYRIDSIGQLETFLD